MSNKFKTDVIIIGAGPVGLFAVFQCAMLGMKSCVIDALEHIGGQCQALYPEKPIYDIPAYKEIKARDLIVQLEKQIEAFNPEFYLENIVTDLEKESDEFTVKTNKGLEITARSVIIAAGAGAFGPNRPPLANIEEFEGKSLFYMVKNPKDFCSKKIIIAGGGDSAVDWALALAEMGSEIYIVHRRNKFRASDETVRKMHYFAENFGNIKIKIPYQLHAINGNYGQISSVDIIDFDGRVENIKADIILPFFGLASDISFMQNWGVEIENNKIKVNPTTAETNIDGIFAIGDIASYPNKLKLILTGFSEAAMAAHRAYSYTFKGKPLHFEYSTSRKIK